jgi:hypothetical protein
MTNFESELVRLHASRELKPNTKGLLGFGCLTLYLDLGILVAFGRAPPLLDRFGHPVNQEVENPFAVILIDCIFGVPAVFSLRGIVRRWRRRRHYAAIVAGVLKEFPPAAPGISAREMQDENARFERTCAATASAKTISRELEAEPIETLPDEIRTHV